ncbi:carboxypeptidase-like regulatory domain-containing protein [Aureliella helgolandensis]|uniref:Carboxypeptidase regulatory-like domain-containing protein n=1 Tax=Aureliella helgolandensis TaxID=2527968 RepID=A0A518GEX5_9BACT|nr:carboxypeptidase-like regulatory domain-containing protein [Aureliella helgolandensis]QDV27149.1 hypothetical protein Q31a_55360 [Aureliella helgolandensis]
MLTRLLTSALLVSFLVGCGDSLPKTEPVTGMVTLDGAPVPMAMVTFLPDDQANGTPATAQTDAEGNFSLTTFNSGDGALAGTYQITVAKYSESDTPAASAETSPAPQLTEEEESKLREAQYSAADAKMANRPIRTKNLIPKKYASKTTSGLTHTVVAGSNEVPLELSSK